MIHSTRGLNLNAIMNTLDKKAGDCSIVKNGYTITIPQEQLNDFGCIPHDIMAKLDDLSVKNLEYLYERYGITAEKANQTLVG
jgi:hypothetical protein